MPADVPHSLHALGLALRPVLDADYPFLRGLYRDVRQQELSVTGWPQETKDAFCDSQFALQDQHYRQHYPDAQFYVIERDGRPIGRVYVSDEADLLALMEVSLSAPERGSGIGHAVMQWLTQWADATQRPMRLYVEPHNPARRLYERHGFEPQEVAGAYLQMQRQATRAPINCG